LEKLSASIDQTLKIGRKLARNLRGGEIILLSGSLGAGKTVLAKGIAQGLGIDQDKVVSPTFVLLRLHQGKYLLQHFDLYRARAVEDIFALGYAEYFYSPAVTIIEWPERLKFLLPREFLKIKLIIKAKNKRLLKFSAKGRRHQELLEKSDNSS